MGCHPLHSCSPTRFPELHLLQTFTFYDVIESLVISCEDCTHVLKCLCPIGYGGPQATMGVKEPWLPSDPSSGQGVSLSWVIGCQQPFSRGSWGYFPVRESDSLSVTMVAIASAPVSTKHFTGKPSSRMVIMGGCGRTGRVNISQTLVLSLLLELRDAPFGGLNFHLCPGVYSHVPSGTLCCSEDTWF